MSHNLNYLFKVYDNVRQDLAFNKTEVTNNSINEALSQIFTPGESYYYVFDFGIMQFTMVSPSVQKIYGIDASDFTPEFLYSRIHPEDLYHVSMCEEKVMDFIFNGIERDDIYNYKMSFNVRFKWVDDTYKLMLHQAVTLSLDDQGRLSKTLIVHSDISHITEENNYQLAFLGMNGRPSFKGIDPKENTTIIDIHKNPYTEREIEVMRLIAEGFTAKEIGEKLFISFDTVRTHRQNLLKKTESKNTTELIAKAVRGGYI